MTWDRSVAKVQIDHLNAYVERIRPGVAAEVEKLLAGALGPSRSVSSDDPAGAEPQKTATDTGRPTK